jgi:triphosphoribosyl-dephospho-CoA synthetase
MIKTVGSGFLVPEEAQHWPRARRFSSAISTRFHRRSRRTISDRSRVATYLASLAVRALIEEAELTPKPALVDERGPGAHTDLSLTLMKSSAQQVSGARGEAQAGFPHVTTIGLPILQRSRRKGSSETQARLDALLAIMANLDDTCLLHRGGLAALNRAQSGAAAVLAARGTATVQGWELLQRLDRDLLALNASPGGSADLLAATLFLDFMVNSPPRPRKRGTLHELTKN